MQQRTRLDFLREWETQRRRERTGLLAMVREMNEKRARQDGADRLLDRLRDNHAPKRASGTLIMGITCQDGVVIASDRKLIRGGETVFSDKIFQLPLGGPSAPVLFAAEGLTGIRDDFFLLLTEQINRRRGVDSLYEVKVIVEDIIATLTDRYAARVRDLSPIGVLMAGLEAISSGKAHLYYIHPEGYGEPVGFRCSGHGGPYAYALAKFLCESAEAPSLRVADAAKRAAFIIAWVADKLDSTVGGDPQVYMLHHDDANAATLPDAEVHGMQELAQQKQEQLGTLLGLTLVDVPTEVNS